jgi:hypothetical protein
MKRCGNGDANCLDFVEEIRVMKEGLGPVSFSNFLGTRGIDIHHTDQLHVFYLCIFLYMELDEVTDTDDTDLEFFHLTTDPPLRALDELKEMLDLWRLSDLILSHLFHRFLQCQAGAKNNAISLLQGPEGLF